MSGLRTVHAIAVIQCGGVLAMVLLGSSRLAIAALAIVTILLTWSIEKLRVAIQTRPENRP
jgi:hypothetical protein